jgi:chloride channel protein, CIC family
VRITIAVEPLVHMRSETAAGYLLNIREKIVRWRELGLLLLAALSGVLAGVVVTAMSWLTSRAHSILFQIPLNERLSGQDSLASPWLALVPVAGGVIIAILAALSRRLFTRPPVDPIEANALHGGRMSVRESLMVAIQTMVSSSYGASVGLEAGYTQASSGLVSHLASRLSMRRSEIRLLVGCASAGAISAAFGAPLTGAFYGFELIIGTYTVSAVAPVMAASLSASLTANWLGAVQNPIDIGLTPAMNAAALAPYILLGILGGLAAVTVMQLVTATENLFRVSRCPVWLRPVLGGAIVGLLGLISPHVLSSGHGALHLDLEGSVTWQLLALLFALKVLASAVSLGSGFRGGLFFASLYLGAILGKGVALALGDFGLFHGLSPLYASLVGMASLAVGVVGGPLTMTFLVLETTRDLGITGAVLAASIVSAVIVRETFGYSFSTWRLHLRGETIRSAHDVGWMRNLTVGRMMRPDVKTVPASMRIADFRAQFPLGATSRVIALDEQGAYAGMVIVADAYSSETGEAARERVGEIAKSRDAMLMPFMNAREAAQTFQIAHAEELAVVDSLVNKKVMGLLTEQHLLRRYAEELDKARRDLTGEG